MAQYIRETLEETGYREVGRQERGMYILQDLATGMVSSPFHRVALVCLFYTETLEKGE